MVVMVMVKVTQPLLFSFSVSLRFLINLRLRVSCWRGCELQRGVPLAQSLLLRFGCLPLSPSRWRWFRVNLNFRVRRSLRRSWQVVRRNRLTRERGSLPSRVSDRLVPTLELARSSQFFQSSPVLNRRKKTFLTVFSRWDKWEKLFFLKPS